MSTIDRLKKMEKEQLPKVSFTLTSVEEKAFYSWYYLNRGLLASHGSWDYELLVLDGIASEIIKEYA